MPTVRPRTIELFVPETWRKEVGETVQTFVPARAVQHLKSIKGEDMFYDTLEYLADAYGIAGEHFGDEEHAVLIDRVLAQFENFRSYHGCRPLSFDSYLREGLQPLSRERLASIAFDLFEGTVPRAEIDSLSQRANLNTRLSRIYFVADREELHRQCGHYLIYGPEALCCLWRDEHDRPTARFRESQERHRVRGIPTILTCDVPVAWIPEEGRRDLGHTLLTQYFQLQSRRPLTPKDWDRNWGYSIDRHLPLGNIHDHTHPEVILDPLRHFTPYHNSRSHCPWCHPPLP